MAACFALDVCFVSKGRRQASMVQLEHRQDYMAEGTLVDSWDCT